MRDVAQTGVQSQFVGGPGCGVRNRGLDFGGMWFAGSKNYSGYFFAKNAAPVTLRIDLFDWRKNTSVGATTVQVEPGSNSSEPGASGSGWVQHFFSVITSASTARSQSR